MLQELDISIRNCDINEKLHLYTWECRHTLKVLKLNDCRDVSEKCLIRNLSVCHSLLELSLGTVYREPTECVVMTDGILNVLVNNCKKLSILSFGIIGSDSSSSRGVYEYEKLGQIYTLSKLELFYHRSGPQIDFCFPFWTCTS